VLSTYARKLRGWPIVREEKVSDMPINEYPHPNSIWEREGERRRVIQVAEHAPAIVYKKEGSRGLVLVSPSDWQEWAREARKVDGFLPPPRP
jgi:hypothetical protein